MGKPFGTNLVPMTCGNVEIMYGKFRSSHTLSLLRSQSVMSLLIYDSGSVVPLKQLYNCVVLLDELSILQNPRSFSDFEYSISVALLMGDSSFFCILNCLQSGKAHIDDC